MGKSCLRVTKNGERRITACLRFALLTQIAPSEQLRIHRDRYTVCRA